jgi:hypothetical protein
MSNNEVEALRRAAIAAHERGDCAAATANLRRMLELSGLRPDAADAIYNLSLANRSSRSESTSQ